MSTSDSLRARGWLRWLCIALALSLGCGPEGADMPCGQNCSALVDSDGCIEGYCDADSETCMTRPKTDGVSCAEHDPVCLISQACISGACVAEPRSCAHSDTDCRVGVCENDRCISTTRADGTPCEDLDACTSADACLSGTCRGVSIVSGNTCAEAVPLPVSDGLHVIDDALEPCHGDAGSPLNGVCLTWDGSGSDVVYSVTLPRTRFVRLQTSEPESGESFRTLLHVRKDVCRSSSAHLTCNSTGVGIYPHSRIQTTFSANTEYFVFMDSFDRGTVGDYRLEFDTRPPETCDTAIEFRAPLWPGHILEIRGDLHGSTDDFSSSNPNECGAGGVDHVIHLIVGSNSDLAIEAITTNGHIPVSLDVRRLGIKSCADLVTASGTCDLQGHADDPESSSVVEGPFLTGGYLIVVEAPPGYDRSKNGGYWLRIRQAPTVEWGASTPSPLRGSATVGTLHESDCGEGYHLSGLHGVVDPATGGIRRLGELCRRDTMISRPGPTRWAIGGETYARPLRGSGTGLSAEAECPPGEAVVGFGGRADVSLTRLEFHCAPLLARGGFDFWTGDDLTWTIGEVAGTTLPIGGASGLPFDDDACPDGTVAVGSTIKASLDGVTGFGLRCATPLE